MRPMAKETHIKTDKKTVGGWGAWELRYFLGIEVARRSRCWIQDFSMEKPAKSRLQSAIMQCLQLLFFVAEKLSKAKTETFLSFDWWVVVPC